MLGGRIARHRIVDDRPSCQRIVCNERLGFAAAISVATPASHYVSVGNIAFLDAARFANASFEGGGLIERLERYLRFNGKSPTDSQGREGSF